MLVTSLNHQDQTRETLNTQKENEYHKQIENLTNLARTSERPEFFYQTIAMTHFKHNQPDKALKAVMLAEENAQVNGTAPLSTYLALFQRAKYYSSFNNPFYLEQAQNDLLQISKMEEISYTKKYEIKKLLDQIELKLLDHEKNIQESNTIQGIPNKKFSGSNPCLYSFEPLYAVNIKNFLLYRKRGIQTRINICPDTVKRWENSTYEECKDILKNYRELLESANEKCMVAERIKEYNPEKADQLFREAEILIDKATESNHPEILARSNHSMGLIQAHLEKYILALDYIEDAIKFEPTNNDLKKLKNNIELKLTKLGPRERLAWIEPLLISFPSDQFLLLFKAEAHFQLDEVIEGAFTAKKLLELFTIKTGAVYEMVFEMANACFFFK